MESPVSPQSTFRNPLLGRTVSPEPFGGSDGSGDSDVSGGSGVSDVSGVSGVSGVSSDSGASGASSGALLQLSPKRGGVFSPWVMRRLHDSIIEMLEQSQGLVWHPDRCSTSARNLSWKRISM